MGDGRYYTYYQMTDVVLITVLIAFAIINTVYCYYRNCQNSDDVNINLPYVIIILFLMIRIVETVIPNLILANNLRTLEVCIMLFFLNLMLVNRQDISHRRKLIGAVVVIFISLILMTDLLVDQYEFHNIIYSLFYKGCLGITVLHILFVNFKQYQYEETKPLYLNRTTSLFKMIFLFMPIIMYFVIALYDLAFICYYELFMIISIMIYLRFQFHINSESSLSILAFDKIGDLSTNYIFVLDTEHRLIYRNETVKKSTFFTEIEIIDIANLERIFFGDSIKKYTHLGKEYIQLTIGHHKDYFTYNLVALNHDDNHIGHIITITKITDLIELLIDLEKKKETSKSANERLKNYSKVVYYIEKNKVINNLLEEVLTSREEQMVCLAELVSKIGEQSDDTVFDASIDKAISRSNELLEEVRHTVSSYRVY